MLVRAKTRVRGIPGHGTKNPGEEFDLNDAAIFSELFGAGSIEKVGKKSDVQRANSATKDPHELAQIAAEGRDIEREKLARREAMQSALTEMFRGFNLDTDAQQTIISDIVYLTESPNPDDFEHYVVTRRADWARLAAQAEERKSIAAMVEASKAPQAAATVQPSPLVTGTLASATDKAGDMAAAAVALEGNDTGEGRTDQDEDAAQEAARADAAALAAEVAAIDDAALLAAAKAEAAGNTSTKVGAGGPKGKGK